MAIYALSDLHGNLELLREIQKFLNEDDTVYFLGDGGDRGPRPWETIKEIYKDKRFIYMKGNHEDMLVKAVVDYIDYECLDYSFQMLASNGGEKTFFDFIDQPLDTQHSWLHVLKNLPIMMTYKNTSGMEIILSHAGFTPDPYKKPKEKDLLWDRAHIYEFVPDEFENTIIVHGHTPIQYMFHDFNDINKLAGKPEIPFEYGAFYYSGTQKICIDQGTYSSGRALLLDLDTFDEHIFETKTAPVSDYNDWL